MWHRREFQQFWPKRAYCFVHRLPTTTFISTVRIFTRKVVAAIVVHIGIARVQISTNNNNRVVIVLINIQNTFFYQMLATFEVFVSVIWGIWRAHISADQKYIPVNIENISSHFEWENVVVISLDVNNNCFQLFPYQYNWPPPPHLLPSWPGLIAGFRKTECPGKVSAFK